MKKYILFSLSAFLGLSALVWAAGGIVYSSNLNFPLYKGESYWGGSQQTELASFIAGGRRVLAAQSRNARSANAPLRRVFHAKQHGCLTAKFNLFKDRPQDTGHQTFVGLFDPSTVDSYEAIVRFSNGLGLIQADKETDVRGAAVKIIGVKNKETGLKQTVDFLMTNAPTPFGKDFLEFAAFMDSVSKYGPLPGTTLFSIGHLRAGKAIVGATGLFNYKTKSVATQRYWSGHPYLLGQNAAMKFNIVPQETTTESDTIIKSWGDDYLRQDLANRTHKGAIKFTVNMQLEKDSDTTPIEDNLKEWLEKDSPSIPVGELVIDKQDFSKRDIDQECANLRFTPGHYIPEHRPLSNLGRGRLFGYEASQFGRNANAQEPDEALVAKWRSLNKTP